MAEIFAKYKEELQNTWQKLNKSVQILIIILTIIMAGVFGYLIFRGTSNSYQPLFTNLTTEDTAAIVERLDENNVDYQLGGNGNTILVPESEIYRLRLDMASAGLPDQGVVGFEIFNSSDFGTTEFERRVNYYRALGGELSRSIQSISGIEFARVQITPPEESLFLAEEKSATASVMVKLRAGYNMSPEQVSAVQNLVASGVQDLPLDEVTIVDTRGNLLSQPSNRGDNNWSNPQNFAMQQEFESSLKNDLTALLTKVLGPNNFAVQVNANLNFDQRQAESKTYTPVVDDSGIVRSEEINTETQENGVTGGAPGVDANIPQYQGAGAAEASSYERENTVTNYEINERIEQHVYAPGEVERLSVSVMIDQNTEEETIDQIRNAVGAAIGYNEDRGDVLNISSIAFDDSLETAAQEAMQAQQAAERRQMYIYGGLILLVLILTSALIIYLYRKKPAADRGSSVNVAVEEDEEEMDLFEPDADQKKRAKLKNELENVIHSDPENAAKLIRSWLVDE
ncbi:flagellar M-ring protein FliF [Halanaerobium saccharolyticum]|uniref:Flagellar M-ring protein n=1 Tax=Halanaerobium saccharolyticum TaxID=43595 RepID=A0A4R7YVB8_9FIRM|nr:flagellar basal-body MS-ring/collar protein FliF [Halanaerobium saccharolyticum]RAK08893.1 flagellar M-ring protein FliF [Halanaerobium saccharolyticum]TDV98933.1 flagellar M-ring protein FliF [Halanaerobium saccharolyticum]TDX60656.1 flagellar M-ring protein FliF [Halanaerobium saccharolyticum]